jgi:hypothetical protein
MPSYTREVNVPGKSAQELYDRVSGDIDRVLEKFNVGKFDVSRDPAKRALSIKGSMLSATLTCGDGKLKLDGKLSLLAAPFKSKIDENIDRWLTKAFNLVS